MATATDTITSDYRVSSINEAGDGRVNVTFVEVVDTAAGNPGGAYGSFNRTFASADAAAFFPGQVYTMTLTKKS